MDRIRTAVIGTGFMGRVHLEALRRVENVDVVEIAATSADKARTAAEGYNVLNSTGDWQDWNASRTAAREQLAGASPVNC